MLPPAMALVLAYLLGAVPASVIVARLHDGIEIRDRGSGNAGAANVLRVLGWRPALVVLAADLAKGWLAVRLASVAGAAAGIERGEELALAAGLAALAGHLWPVWAGFRGGKGVAVSGGAILALDPLAFVVCALAFVAAVALSRRVSVGSLCAAVVLPCALALERFRDPAAVSASRVAFGVAVALVLVVAHRSNLRNLLAGTEPRLGERGAPR